MKTWPWMTLGMLVTGLGSPAHAVTIDPARPPTIHLVREGQNLSALEMLKNNYDICVLGARQRGFQANPPPNWQRLFITRVEEYFDGPRYARYTHTQSYRFNDHCALQITERPRGEIDDGQFRYLFRIGQGRVQKMPSPAVTTRQAQRELQNFARQNPQLAVDSANTLGVPELSTRLTSATVGTDTVLNERCDYVTTNVTGAHRLCYWSTLRAYPGIVRRPIILKAIIPMGDKQNIEQAIHFNVGGTINQRVFSPPR